MGVGCDSDFWTQKNADGSLIAAITVVQIAIVTVRSKAHTRPSKLTAEYISQVLQSATLAEVPALTLS